METSALVVGSVYTVDLHPERLYGTTLRDVTFAGRMDSALVPAYGVIPAEEHRKVYSSLPDGVPNDARQYSWLAFKTLNGDLEIIGEPWVVAGSVVGGDVEDIWDITDIKGDSTTPGIIKSALSAVGIYQYTIAKRNS